MCPPPPREWYPWCPRMGGAPMAWEGGTHLSPGLSMGFLVCLMVLSGWGQPSLPMTFLGGTHLFPQGTLLSVGHPPLGSPRSHGFLPLPLHTMAPCSAQPRAGFCRLPRHCPLPATPNLGAGGSPCSHACGGSWALGGYCFSPNLAPSPRKSWVTAPQSGSSSAEDAPSTTARLWGQHWVAVPCKRGGRELATLRLWLPLSPVPCCWHGAGDAGDTTSVEGTCPLAYGVCGTPGVGGLWWLKGVPNQPRMRCPRLPTFGDRWGTPRCCDAQLSLLHEILLLPKRGCRSSGAPTPCQWDAMTGDGDPSWAAPPQGPHARRCPMPSRL